MVDLAEMTEAEAEAYVRDLATSMLASNADVPTSLFILAALEASIRVVMIAHLDEHGEQLNSVEALEKLKDVINEIQTVEGALKPVDVVSH